MGSLGDELSLGSICGSRRGVSKILKVMMVEKVEEHVKKLEEEKRKLESSELELPLSMQILNDAILYLREEQKRCLEMDTQKPLLKDFNFLNKPIREEELLQRKELMSKNKFQLWKANDDHIERIEDKSSMLLIPKVETGLGLGLTSSSIRREVNVASCGLTCNSMPQPQPQPAFLQQQASRKQRRCWTPELHRRFVDALQLLGGPGVATPKQIREQMQEKDLTNDEVKSHLQKYRLHIRKPSMIAEKQSSAVVLGFSLWNSSSQEKEEEEETGEGVESSKGSNSQSDSPQGPLQLPATTTTTTTGGDSSMEDTEDAKSVSFQMGRD